LRGDFFHGISAKENASWVIKFEIVHECVFITFLEEID
jgi:hypothetical protein